MHIGSRTATATTAARPAAARPGSGDRRACNPARATANISASQTASRTKPPRKSSVKYMDSVDFHT